ncbi:MAG: DNA polymerase III subunit delta' [Acaryochloridaceae cyanobacterium SU_2_1]|nr:DNA polymerase III subunit delta' [Acaryochloridaceae cyanobacterium SU_2_1]
MAIEYLSAAIAQQRTAPAYLFSGPAGVGRRLVAERFLGQLLWQEAADPSKQQRRLSNHPDCLWIGPSYIHQGKPLTAQQLQAQDLPLPNSQPQVRLVQIRALSQFLSQAPLEATQLAVVIEGAETMAEPAANALLKTLEEPGNATVILIAPSAEALLPTLVSRCQRIPFYRLTPAEMVSILKRVGYAEIIDHPHLLEMAQGSPGSAIAHWQQFQAIAPELLQVDLTALQSPRACLALAQQIDHSLELHSQLWLLDYWQHHCWQGEQNSQILHPLETAKQQLLHHAQPRLVWEVTLLTVADYIGANL